MSGASLLIALVAVALSGAPQEPAKPEAATTQFASGEVIVKFTGGSKAAEIVHQALQDETKSNAQLASHFSGMAQEIGIPFQVKQLTSGGEVVFSVQERDLISKLSEQLKQSRCVAEVRETEFKDKDKGPMRATTGLLVSFRAGSRPAKAVAGAPANAQLNDPDLQKFIEKLEQKLGFAVAARINEKKEFLMSVDVRAVTLELVKRLANRADVEYAQPNFLLQKTGTAEFMTPCSGAPAESGG